MWRPLLYPNKKRSGYIDLACDDSLKRMFTSGNPTIFWISLNDEYPAALAKKALRMVIRFATSYLREAGFSAMTVIKKQNIDDE